MSKFEEVFGGGKKENRPMGQDFEGTFQCQTCWDDVNLAKWFPAEGLLVWECQAGHRSYIENFKLG